MDEVNWEMEMPRGKNDFPFTILFMLYSTLSPSLLGERFLLSAPSLSKQNVPLF